MRRRAETLKGFVAAHPCWAATGIPQFYFGGEFVELIFVKLDFFAFQLRYAPPPLERLSRLEGFVIADGHPPGLPDLSECR